MHEIFARTWPVESSSETVSVTETDEVSQFAPVTSPEGSQRLVTHRGVPDSGSLDG